MCCRVCATGNELVIVSGLFGTVHAGGQSFTTRRCEDPDTLSNLILRIFGGVVVQLLHLLLGFLDVLPSQLLAFFYLRDDTSSVFVHRGGQFDWW